MSEEEQNQNVADRLAKARGDEIRQAREARGWSQAELAKRAHTSQQTVDRIERGVVGHSRALPEVRRLLGLEIYGPVDFSVPPIEGQDEKTNEGYRAAIQEARAAGKIMDKRMIPVFAEGKARTRLIDAIPRAFPYEFVEGANAVLITENSMEPVLRPGDIAVLNPNVPALPGSEVGFADKGLLYVRTLVREDAESWIVKSWNPPSETRIPKSVLSYLDVMVTRITRNR